MYIGDHQFRLISHPCTRRRVKVIIIIIIIINDDDDDDEDDDNDVDVGIREKEQKTFFFSLWFLALVILERTSIVTLVNEGGKSITNRNSRGVSLGVRWRGKPRQLGRNTHTHIDETTRDSFLVYKCVKMETIFRIEQIVSEIVIKLNLISTWIIYSHRLIIISNKC